MNNNYLEEILEIITTELSKEEFINKLENYHFNDIAEVLIQTDKETRIYVYNLLGVEKTAKIFSFYENVEDYISELPDEYAADVLEEMDSDDAVYVLNELEEEEKDKLIELLEEDVQEQIKKIDSYGEDLIGSYMSDNFIVLPFTHSITSAMSTVIKKAGDCDNIFTLYIIDENQKYMGVVSLKDLIISRRDDDFVNLIMTSFPFFYDDEVMSECIERIKDYGEVSLPVLNRNLELVGVVTSNDIIEVTEDEFEEDYAKFGGLTEEEEIDEPIRMSIRKRIPWLITLLFLGLVVSCVVGVFEGVIASLPVIVFFQSMILGMAGNAGTQSLAVTIRNIANEKGSGKEHKFKGSKKEFKIGLINGLLMGIISFVVVLVYLIITKKSIISESGFVFNDAIYVAGIIGISMMVSICLSSIIGNVFPILLTKLHIDPAVASGPFITTIIDITSIVIYYGLTYLFFMMVL